MCRADGTSLESAGNSPLGRFGCVDEVASTSVGWVLTSHVDVHLSCYLNLVRFVEENGDRIYLILIILYVD